MKCARASQGKKKSETNCTEQMIRKRINRRLQANMVCTQCTASAVVMSISHWCDSIFPFRLCCWLFFSSLTRSTSLHFDHIHLSLSITVISYANMHDAMSLQIRRSYFNSRVDVFLLPFPF